MATNTKKNTVKVEKVSKKVATKATKVEKASEKKVEKKSDEQIAFEAFLKKNPKFESIARHAGKGNMLELFVAGFRKGKSSK